MSDLCIKDKKSEETYQQYIGLQQKKKILLKIRVISLCQFLSNL